MASSPWGQIQVSTQVAPGIRWVSTAGHGGLMVTARVAEKELSHQVQEMGNRYGDYYCYEEDCAWALAARELTAVRDHAIKQEGQTAERFDETVRGTIQRWYPEYSAKHVSTNIQQKEEN